ncbi:structure-specific recognition protein 1 [Trypanosoma rangeli]|uniref:Structure-specific recognition protein 1 n=1 Tax=Trypanosoma rangeli TaxID=5698 RepID=A0A422P127_TRYRA|nr:structure-specific recognition protein 1 [Trypanosoma rangeli]RNF11385.1 structure-specific recognition protein 1 [Trypanosoma rangeli]|eukprot:RNF11385.1 structure-specific recognition protein 1 [Trypanosoma rangeli]
MSSLTGVTAATTTLPVENWGALRWATRQPQQKLADVKKEEKTGDENGASVDGDTEVVLQLVSLPKPQHHSSGTPPNVVGKPIIEIPVSSIASASATTKNDLSLSLRPQSSVTTTQGGGGVAIELTSIRFAIPNVCVGHEQTEEAGREILAETQDAIKKHQSRLLGAVGDAFNAGADNQLLMMMAGGPRRDERVVAVLDDLTLSYPSGRYKLILSNYSLILEDKKRAATGNGGVAVSVPLSDVVQLYLCDIPDSGAGEQENEELAQYVVVILRNPLKVRTTTYNHLVISCPAGFSLDEEHPWRCQLETQEEIDGLLATLPHNQSNAANGAEGGKVIRNTFAPMMSGRVSEILIRVLKALTGVTALGGFNREYQTSKGNSVLRCLHHGAHGLLFVLQSALLFLHRPVTRALLSEITHVEVDEAGGSATFQMVVYGKFGGRVSAAAENKLVFSALDKREKADLLEYLGKKVTVRRIGLSVDDDDNDDDDDEDVDEDEDEEDEAEEEEEEESDDDDGDSDYEMRRHKRSRQKKDKSEKEKSKKEKKEKHHHHHHHKRHKKHKKEGE